MFVKCVNARAVPPVFSLRMDFMNETEKRGDALVS